MKTKSIIKIIINNLTTETWKTQSRLLGIKNKQSHNLIQRKKNTWSYYYYLILFMRVYIRVYKKKIK